MRIKDTFGRLSTRDHGKLLVLALTTIKYTYLFLREALQEDPEGRILAPDKNELYKAKRRKSVSFMSFMKALHHKFLIIHFQRLFDHKSQVKLGMVRMISVCTMN